jgi:hypothetical protein
VIKNIYYSSFILLVTALLFASCQKEKVESIPLPEWLIDKNDIHFGSGKDGIVSIEFPKFVSADQIDFLAETSILVVVNINEETKAYPYKILNYHEVVNDDLGGEKISITYCPLTGTSSVINREIDGSVTTFGVSGLLYNSNLIMYDRESCSYWGQMLGKCISGPKISRKIKSYPFLEINFKAFKKMFPDALVLDRNTSFNRNYFTNSYGGYASDHVIAFPVQNTDDRLFSKEKVLGIRLGRSAWAVRTNILEGKDMVVSNIIVENKRIVIIGHGVDGYLTGFDGNAPDGTQLMFHKIEHNISDPSIVMEDNEGNQWDIFGKCTSGPRMGQNLVHEDVYPGYWFAWSAFHPNIFIFEN